MKKVMISTLLVSSLCMGQVFAAATDTNAAGYINPLSKAGAYVGVQGGGIFGGGFAATVMGNAGYQFNKYLAVEADAYVPITRFGRFILSSVDAKLILPLQNKPIAFYVKAGPAMMSVDLFGYKAHAFTASAGAGMQYALSDHLALDAGYTNIGGSFNFVTGGVSYHF